MNEFVLKHAVREPSRGNRNAAPMLVLLHGLRSNEQDLLGLAPYLDPRFFVVSARAPVSMEFGAYAWYNVEFVPGGYIIDAERAERSRTTLLEFVEQLTRSYHVDPERVFLMGFSQGAAMSVAAALSSPTTFAGIVPMSGRFIDELRHTIAEDVAPLPVFQVHGTRDAVIPIEHGRALRDELAKLPVVLSYREYDMAHQVTEESLGDISAWLTERLDD